VIDPLGAVADRWQITLVVVEHDGSLVLVAEPARIAVPCPRRGELSRRSHSRYARRPVDLPWRVEPSACGCTHGVGSVMLPAARGRSSLNDSRVRSPATPVVQRARPNCCRSFALQAGVEGGARLARKAGVPTSPDTLLRMLHAMLDALVRTPRVLGVDDVALRRGRGVRQVAPPTSWRRNHCPRSCWCVRRRRSPGSTWCDPGG
jgi:hypothetical protein